jgi:hypothetical protein
MTHLLIKCEECKAIVDTGVNIDFESFCTSEFEKTKVICNKHSCGKRQLWSKDDVLAISFCIEKNLDKK